MKLDPDKVIIALNNDEDSGAGNKAAKIAKTASAKHFGKEAVEIKLPCKNDFGCIVKRNFRMAKEKLKEKILSASRLKTLETCTWSYWCNYHLKLPQKQNEGAQRGTVCHLVFEMLVKKKHRKHYDRIVKANSIDGSPAIVRLVMKHLRQMEKSSDLPMTNEENTTLVWDMIMVGLKHDFFGWGGKVDNPEFEFLLEKDDPKYKIRGFIDKPVVYKRGKKIKIVDYKSSKYKFRGEELHSNVQAMTYTLQLKNTGRDINLQQNFCF